MKSEEYESRFQSPRLRVMAMVGCVTVAVLLLCAAMAFSVYSLTLGWDGDWFGWTQAFLAACGCFEINRTFMAWGERMYPELGGQS